MELTLCWKCAKACAGCSWSKEFKPVEGWKARKTKVFVSNSNGQGGVYRKLIDSYMVEECPEFEDDTDQYSKPTKRDKWNSAPYLQGEPVCT